MENQFYFLQVYTEGGIIETRLLKRANDIQDMTKKA